jgi:hypothetical protein
MDNDPQNYSTFTPTSATDLSLMLTDGKTVPVAGRGTVLVGNDTGTLALTNALCAPAIPNKLWSVASATLNDLCVYFNERGEVLVLESDGREPTGTVLAQGYRENRTFYLDIAREKLRAFAIAKSTSLYRARVTAAL